MILNSSESLHRSSNLELLNPLNREILLELRRGELSDLFRKVLPDSKLEQVTREWSSKLFAAGVFDDSWRRMIDGIQEAGVDWKRTEQILQLALREGLAECESLRRNSNQYPQPGLAATAGGSIFKSDSLTKQSLLERVKDSPECPAMLMVFEAIDRSNVSWVLMGDSIHRSLDTLTNAATRRGFLELVALEVKSAAPEQSSASTLWCSLMRRESAPSEAQVSVAVKVFSAYVSQLCAAPDFSTLKSNVIQFFLHTRTLDEKQLAHAARIFELLSPESTSLSEVLRQTTKSLELLAIPEVIPEQFFAMVVAYKQHRLPISSLLEFGRVHIASWEMLSPVVGAAAGRGVDLSELHSNIFHQGFSVELLMQAAKIHALWLKVTGPERSLAEINGFTTYLDAYIGFISVRPREQRTFDRLYTPEAKRLISDVKSLQIWMAELACEAFLVAPAEKEFTESYEKSVTFLSFLSADSAPWLSRDSEKNPGAEVARRQVAHIQLQGLDISRGFESVALHFRGRGTELSLAARCGIDMAAECSVLNTRDKTATPGPGLIITRPILGNFFKVDEVAAALEDKSPLWKYESAWRYKPSSFRRLAKSELVFTRLFTAIIGPEENFFEIGEKENRQHYSYLFYNDHFAYGGGLLFLVPTAALTSQLEKCRIPAENYTGVFNHEFDDLSKGKFSVQKLQQAVAALGGNWIHLGSGAAQEGSFTQSFEPFSKPYCSWQEEFSNTAADLWGHPHRYFVGHSFTKWNQGNPTTRYYAELNKRLLLHRKAHALVYRVANAYQEMFDIYRYGDALYRKGFTNVASDPYRMLTEAYETHAFLSAKPDVQRDDFSVLCHCHAQQYRVQPSATVSIDTFDLKLRLRDGRAWQLSSNKENAKELWRQFVIPAISRSEDDLRFYWRSSVPAHARG